MKPRTRSAFADGEDQMRCRPKGERPADVTGNAVRRIVLLIAVILIAGGMRAIAADEASDRGARLAKDRESGAAAAKSSEAYEPKTYIVRWALGPKSRTEANQAAAVLRAYYGRGGEVVVKANTPATAVVTAATLQAALRDVGAQMNREQDLLVLVLTSHGSPEGIGIRTRRHGEMLTPNQLRAYLQETGAANKVVIISACYSGIFSSPLTRAQHITGGRDPPSFGCSTRPT
jgi:hypothetical protein